MFHEKDCAGNCRISLSASSLLRRAVEDGHKSDKDAMPLPWKRLSREQLEAGLRKVMNEVRRLRKRLDTMQRSRDPQRTVEQIGM